MSKKILYMDLDSLKSVSAQLYEGNLIDDAVSELQTEGERLQDDYGSSEAKRDSFSAGIEAVAKYSGFQENQTYEGKEIEELKTSTFQETKRRAYDEYLVNLVQTSLKEDGDLKSLDDFTEYDYLEFDGVFDFYDFDTAEKSLDYTTVIPTAFTKGMVMPEYEDLYSNYKKSLNSKNADKRKEAEKFQSMLSVKSINKIMGHLNKLMGSNFCLINKETGFLIIGNKNNLSLPSISLALKKTLKIKVFGIAISNEELNISDNFTHKNPHDIFKSVSSFPLENYLVNFFGFKNNSKLTIIHPISIEYSTD